MIIKQEKAESITTHNICEFHKKNPNKDYAGCTCSVVYTIYTITK